MWSYSSPTLCCPRNWICLRPIQWFLHARVFSAPKYLKVSSTLGRTRVFLLLIRNRGVENPIASVKIWFCILFFVCFKSTYPLTIIQIEIHKAKMSSFEEIWCISFKRARGAKEQVHGFVWGLHSWHQAQRENHKSSDLLAKIWILSHLIASEVPFSDNKETNWRTCFNWI